MSFLHFYVTFLPNEFSYMRNSTLTIVAILLLTVFSLDGAAQVVAPSEFKSKVESGRRNQIVDVRTRGEFDAGHVVNALNVDINGKEFESQVAALDPSVPILVYCLSGGRSAKAATYMRNKGFVVFELEGGMLKWKANNFPVESSRPVAKGLSVAEYNRKVSSERLVLVDFYAPWCAPCRKMAPDLDALAEQYKDRLDLIKINVDQNSIVVKEMKIESLPVLKLYKAGVVVWSSNQLVSKAEMEKILVKNF